MDVLIKILQFLLSFSMLIIVHELGHFLMARLFGVRVERFQLFFGSPLLRRTFGQTEYAVGWFPMGGFVTLSGMIDESMNLDQMQNPPQEYEFRTKAAWKRLLIMLGGVLMNVILAFAIYVGICFAVGERYIVNDMPYGCVFSDTAKSLGFKDGDRVISVAGREIDDFSKIVMALAIESDDRSVVLLRGGDTVTIVAPIIPVSAYTDDPEFIMPRYPFVISEIVDGMGASAAGLRPGDRLVEFNGQSVEFFDQYRTLFAGSASQSVNVGFVREGSPEVLHADISVSEDGKIGAVVSGSDFLHVAERRYSFLEAVPAGVRRVGTEMSDYWKQLKMMVRPETEAYKSLGGPIAIGSIFPSEWDWEFFWRISAMLSVVLAIMNVLPIPALDGGHVLFLLCEIVTGRRMSDRAMTAVQMAGLIFLLLLTLYVTCHDIVTVFFR